MTKTLYLMRHGQTLFNTQGRVQGWCDSPLTDLGQDQARAAGRWFADQGIRFDEAYSSTQERATDTAKLVIDLPVTQLKGLKEMNFGSFEAQPEALLPKHRPGATSFEDLLVPYGGEDIRDVGRRVEETLLELLEHSRAETLLAVSHGAALWGLVQVSGFAWPADFGLPNCTICQLSYCDQEKRLKLDRVIDPVAGRTIETKE